MLLAFFYLQFTIDFIIQTLLRPLAKNFFKSLLALLIQLINCIPVNELSWISGFHPWGHKLKLNIFKLHQKLLKMARKKKSLQEEEEEDALSETSIEPIEDDKEKPEDVQQTPMHNSDSEVFELNKSLLQKNKSNLFIIKSYSFNDKTSIKRPKQLRLNAALTPKHQLADSRESSEEQQLSLKKEKHKKVKKAKSTYDSTENLHELQALLRKPPIAKVVTEGEMSASCKRPLVIGGQDKPHAKLAKAKTMEDIDTRHIKRESFLRHSLQSIRRSFTSSKKHQSSVSSASPLTSACSSLSSSGSTTSSGSEASGSLKKSKAQKKKESIREQEHMADIYEEMPRLTVTVQGDSVIFNRLDAPMNHHPTTTNIHNISNTPGNALGLTVLREEDEKDIPLTPERSTSSVSALAQLPSDPLASMAPLHTHIEAHSVQFLNTLDDRDGNKSSKANATTNSSNNSNNNNNNNNTNTNTTSNNNNNTTASKSSSSSSSSPQQPTKNARRNVLQHQLSIAESLEASSIGCATSSEYSSARSLKHSSSSLAPPPPQSVPSSSSLRSISPSRASSSNSSSTAKHEQSAASTAAAAAAAASSSAAGAGGASGAATTSAGAVVSMGGIVATVTPPEKEKKRKEVSSSRVKKFHRHFTQVSKDEKLINYFSCALVSDILLQGHLYITDQHFAFYSNVFGYVTKVVIPTSSVTKISKEKTAKIIPNAVGVATADERHVFGSFISREAAFRLMVSVCSPHAPAEILPKDTTNAEIPEEYSIEDDSSCSISGNESPAQITENGNSSNEQQHGKPSPTIMRRGAGGSSGLSISDPSHDKLARHSDIPANAKSPVSARASAPPTSNGGGIGHIISQISASPATAIGCATIEGNVTLIAAGSASTTTSAATTPTPSTSSSPTTVLALPQTKIYQVLSKFRALGQNVKMNMRFPTEVHVVYVGATLTVILAVFTMFLLYRILDIEAKTNVYRSPAEFNWQSGNDDDVFAEALRFQKQLQEKSTEEAQNIIKTNLEQINKVRRSLETLSMLIHDRISSYVAPSTASSTPGSDGSD